MSKKEKQTTFIDATIREEEGCIIYTSILTGKDIAIVLPKTGRVADLRTSNYLPISPCPYCRAEKDKGHNPLKHTDPFLGEKI